MFKNTALKISGPDLRIGYTFDFESKERFNRNIPRQTTSFLSGPVTTHCEIMDVFRQDEGPDILLVKETRFEHMTTRADLEEELKLEKKETEEDLLRIINQPPPVYKSSGDGRVYIALTLVLGVIFAIGWSVYSIITNL